MVSWEGLTSNDLRKLWHDGAFTSFFFFHCFADLLWRTDLLSPTCFINGLRSKPFKTQEGCLTRLVWLVNLVVASYAVCCLDVCREGQAKPNKPYIFVMFFVLFLSISDLCKNGQMLFERERITLQFTLPLIELHTIHAFLCIFLHSISRSKRKCY